MFLNAFADVPDKVPEVQMTEPKASAARDLHSFKTLEFEVKQENTKNVKTNPFNLSAMEPAMQDDPDGHVMHQTEARITRHPSIWKEENSTRDLTCNAR